IGVFFLFALAGRHVRFGQSASESELLRSIIDGDDAGILVTDGTGRVVARNTAFATLVGTNALGEINTLEALFASDRTGAEAPFRRMGAGERGEPAAEELMVQGQAGAYGRWLRVSVKPIDLAVAPDVSRLKLWRIEDVTFDRVRQNN